MDRGFAVTFDAVEEFNEAAGLHVYVLAPVTLREVDCPVQMVSSGETMSTGAGLTDTVTCCEAVQPNKSPITV